MSPPLESFWRKSSYGKKYPSRLFAKSLWMATAVPGQRDLASSSMRSTRGVQQPLTPGEPRIALPSPSKRLESAAGVAAFPAWRPCLAPVRFWASRAFPTLTTSSRCSPCSRLVCATRRFQKHRSLLLPANVLMSASGGFASPRPDEPRLFSPRIDLTPNPTARPSCARGCAWRF